MGERPLGPFSGAAISVGATIGSGIFLLPAYVAHLLPDANWFLGVWLVGALLALCSALSYAELAAVFPLTGGYGIYLRRMFGPRVAFVYGWSGALILWPSSIAGLGHAFAISLRDLAGVAVPGAAIACAAIALCATTDLSGLRSSARAQSWLSGGKLAALLGLALLGLLRGGAAPETASASFSFGWMNALLALVAVSWCFEGFLEIVLLAGETRDARRTVGRVLVGSVLALACVYLLYLLALLRGLGIAGIAGNEAVAAALAERALGAAGRAVVNALVLLATSSAILALLNSGPRLLVGLAREGVLPDRFSRVYGSQEVPREAILAMAVVAMAYALGGGFTELVKFFGLCTALFSSLILIGGMRWRGLGRVDASQRRIPWWPFPPLLALCANLGAAISVLRDQPRASSLGLLLILAAIPLARHLKGSLNSGAVTK